ncbi:MAG: DHH family phosphoesterase [Chloroflexaceae bacterium]|nr:DHH family phosphoesterase [Chloroflexaceae bacterium]
MNRHDTLVRQANEWVARISNARNIMLVTHVNPDGDAIGSVAGLYAALPQITSAHITMVVQQPVPAYLAWLPDIQHSCEISEHKAWPNPDLIIAVDCAAADRIGGIHAVHAQTLQHSTIIQVDHHATNTLFGVQNLIIEKACATCEIITEFLPMLGITMTPGIATPLLLGIMTDTQSFQIYDTRADTLQLGAKLFAAGADHASIVQKVFRSTRREALQLASRVLSTMRVHDHVVWTAVPLAWLEEFNATDDESDEALGMLQRIDGFEVIMLIKERKNGVKISLRSRNVIVAAIATRHGGGGHAHAAGINLPGFSIEAAANLLLPELHAACTAFFASTKH